MRKIFPIALSMTVMACAGAATYSSFPKTCKPFAPPVVNVSYTSRPVRYDFSKSADELTRQKSDSPNPYGPGAETHTEGLRYDRPVIETKTSESVLEFPVPRLYCIAYNRIDVTVLLEPVIYIANRWRPGPCRSAILEHEQKHVKVDHDVMDMFIPRIRAKIEAAAAKAGTMGPLDMKDQDQVQDFMTKNIGTIVDIESKALHDENVRRQANVDSLAEYQRVSAICGPEQ